MGGERLSIDLKTVSLQVASFFTYPLIIYLLFFFFTFSKVPAFSSNLTLLITITAC